MDGDNGLYQSNANGVQFSRNINNIESIILLDVDFISAELKDIYVLDIYNNRLAKYLIDN